MVTLRLVSRRVPTVAAPLTVAVVAFAAARVAMLPGLAFWDTAELQTVGPVMGTAHPAGFPTYVLLGWFASVVLQPFGEAAFRMNLLAGLCLALAAGLTVDLVRVLVRSTALAIVAGLGLALTPIAWSIGTHAEAHALHLVFVVLLLRLLVGWENAVTRHAEARADTNRRRVDRWLIGAAVVFGLSVGNHSLTLLLALPVLLFIHRVEAGALRNTRLAATCVLAFAVTVVLVYLELPLRAGPFRAPLVYGRPETWDGFWYVVLGEQFRANVISPFADLPGKVGSLVDRTIVQFGVLAPLIPLGFFATAIRRPPFATLTGSAVLITTFFAASYQNAEIDRYYLGPLAMAWTWLAILGKAAADALARLLDERSPDERSPDHRTRQLLALLASIVLVSPVVLAAPERYRDVDESRDVSAVQWVEAALARMPENSVLVSWWSYSTPLWYAQLIEGRRPDLTVIDDRTRLDQDLGGITDVIDAYLGKRPVFVIRDDPLEAIELAARYELEYLDGFDARTLTRVVALRQPGS